MKSVLKVWRNRLAFPGGLFALGLAGELAQSALPALSWSSGVTLISTLAFVTAYLFTAVSAVQDAGTHLSDNEKSFLCYEQDRVAAEGWTDKELRELYHDMHGISRRSIGYFALRQPILWCGLLLQALPPVSLVLVAIDELTSTPSYFVLAGALSGLGIIGIYDGIAAAQARRTTARLIVQHTLVRMPSIAHLPPGHSVIGST